MNQPESGSIIWRTSSYSSNGGNCVEVGRRAADVLIRDTKHRAGGSLTLGQHAWRCLLTAAVRP